VQIFLQLFFKKINISSFSVFLILLILLSINENCLVAEKPLFWGLFSAVGAISAL